jgi:hypothetical protein
LRTGRRRQLFRIANRLERRMDATTIGASWRTGKA